MITKQSLKVHKFIRLLHQLNLISLRDKTEAYIQIEKVIKAQNRALKDQSNT